MAGKTMPKNKTDKYAELKNAFETIKDDKNAVSMSAYMRNQFAFYGIATPKRKAVYKDFLKAEKSKGVIDWDFLDKCQNDEHREFQYLVSDYLLFMKQYVTFEDMPKIRNYITDKSWWDTIDFLCKVIGDVGLRDDRIKGLMVEWSEDENFWIRRTAIEHQLGLKDKTDAELLEKIITNCFGSNEFFINKAIGWALREYSKTDPEWVRSFIGKHKEEMNSLSIREASKYI